MLYVGLAFLLCLFSSCNQPTTTAKNATSNFILSSESVPKDTLIVLERTPCGSNCPVYKLTIKGDGTVTFEGRKNVKKIGVFRGTVSQDQIKQLIADSERINFFSLRDRYAVAEDGCNGSLYDSPTVKVTIKLNNKSKTIYHYYGCVGAVPELKRFENEIDEIANSRQWVE